LEKTICSDPEGRMRERERETRREREGRRERERESEILPLLFCVPSMFHLCPQTNYAANI
jgi:hypothetical protein